MDLLKRRNKTITTDITTLKNNRILISQPAPVSLEKSPFRDLIEKDKIEVVFAPFIQIEGISSKDFRAQRVNILAHTAVIFTSRTTIDNFFRICEECRVTVPEDMKYFCVTESIALYLQKYIIYRKRKIFFGKGTFADLVDIVVKHKEEKFLVALSDPHKPEIPQTLDKAKIKYDKVILARTVSTDVRSRIDNIGQFDLLVFYSPFEITSLVNNFQDQLGPDVRIATFGAGTAKAACNAGLNVCVLAPTREFPSMGMAISNYIAQVRKGAEIDTSYIQEYIQEDHQKSEELIAKVKIISKTKKTVKKKTTATKKDGGSKSLSSKTVLTSSAKMAKNL